MRTRAFFMVVSLFDSVSMPGGRRLGCDQNHGLLDSRRACDGDRDSERAKGLAVFFCGAK